jgi:hypothetical protein
MHLELAVLLALALNAPPIDAGTAKPREGTLSSGQIRKFVQDQVPALQRCHQQPDGGPTGQINLTFTITPDGGARFENMFDRTLFVPAIDSCLRKVVEGWRFPFKPSKALTISLPIPFGTHSPGPAADVMDNARRDSGAIKACYLNHGEGKGGKMSVQFTLTTEGKTRAVSVKEDNFDRPELGKCLVKLVEGWTVTKKPSTDTVLDFPFGFGPPTK